MLGDLNAMFEEVNNLPADDPLRQPANAAAMAQNRSADAAYDAGGERRSRSLRGLAAAAGEGAGRRSMRTASDVGDGGCA